jgi:hypothetical protein
MIWQILKHLVSVPTIFFSWKSFHFEKNVIHCSKWRMRLLHLYSDRGAPLS